VTWQVRTIRSLPLTISFKGVVEIQGEGLMRLSVLDKINKSCVGEPLRNARNAAAGSIRNLDTSVAASRNLDIVVYGINYIEGEIYRKISAEDLMNQIKGNINENNN